MRSLRASVCTFLAILAAELIKLRKSAAVRLILIFPVLFLIADFLLFGYYSLETDWTLLANRSALTLVPIKSVGALWTGFIHPLLLASLPALVFGREHRSSAWKHLNAMPVSPKSVFLGKFLVILILAAACLLLAALALWAEWLGIAAVHRGDIRFPFPWGEMTRVMGWLLLGSLPVLAIYTGISARISSGAIPVVFALMGLLLNISLSGHELDPSWRRDLIPWVLPYSCAQQAIENAQDRQEVHLAGVPFRKEEDLSRLTGTRVEYLPSGRKVTTTTTIPDYFLKPPPPTPKWLLAGFSWGAGLVLLSLGLLDARRNRA